MEVLQKNLQNYFCTTSLASFNIFCFLQFFTLFNFSSSSTIVFLIQSFIYSNHWFLKFPFDFLYRFLNLYLLKIYSFTLFNLSSTSTIPLPF